MRKGELHRWPFPKGYLVDKLEEEIPKSTSKSLVPVSGFTPNPTSDGRRGDSGPLKSDPEAQEPPKKDIYQHPH